MAAARCLRIPVRTSPTFSLRHGTSKCCNKRSYHSTSTTDAPPYTPLESSILSSALSHVPREGFTLTALRSGLRANGYLDASTALFPEGAFAIALYHLRTQRLGLKDRVQFPNSMSSSSPPSTASIPPRAPLNAKAVSDRVRQLLLARLRGNVDAGVAGARWSEALGLMSLAGNIPASVKELALLSDEVLFLAGDTSVDASWYGKRAALSSAYAAAELFQSADGSTDFVDTEAFLDRRLDEVRVLGSAWRDVREWAGFQGVAAVNLARSLGVRI